MTNYNYYNNLTNRFKKNNSIGQKEKTYMPTFDKPVYEGYNGEKTKSYTPSYEYKTGYGNTQNRWWETNFRRGDNSLYKPKVSEKEKPIYRKTDFQENNLVKDRFNISNPSFKGDPWFEITPPDTTYDPGFLISDNTENPWKDTFKKKAQNQWYNKIAHGSFKEDDWFDSMVKNQEKAENWYKNTYGEKEGKKEFNNLHNRLVTTPFDKIKEEEKQFASYKASDFKVPEIKPVKYSYNRHDTKNKDSKKVTENTGNRKQATNAIRKNANNIRDAAYRYGVDPVIVAACIYGEQAMNYDLKDTISDSIAYFLNTSIGVGQVRVSTAKELEDFGYVEPVKYIEKVDNWNGNNSLKTLEKWYIPGWGEVIVSNRDEAIAYRLTIDSECINYVAAYVASLQKAWEWAYPDIYRDTAITATLYNQGVGNPKSNPEPNEFGKFIRANYDYIKDIFYQNLK